MDHTTSPFEKQGSLTDEQDLERQVHAQRPLTLSVSCKLGIHFDEYSGDGMRDKVDILFAQDTTIPGTIVQSLYL